MAYKKVNTNDMLQLRRPFKSLTTNWCILCMGNGGMIDRLFLHCPINSGLWHNLFKQARLHWVQPKSIRDMMTISYRDLGSSIKGKILWKMACLTLFWIIWHERNLRIFEDKWGMSEILWDLLHFYSSFGASCTDYFKGIPLNFIQLNWHSMCRPKGLD